MRRPYGAPTRQLALFLALGLCALAVPARAALVTDVADAADKDDPLDVNLDLRWTRTQRNAKITREFFDGTKTYLATEMATQRYTHVLDFAGAIGLYHDLELHWDIPWAATDEQHWGYSTVDGVNIKDRSSIQNNRLDADGAQQKTPQPLFPVPGQVFRGGWLDPSIGLAWAIFNGERDEKLPEKWFPHKVRTATWVLGFDYTMPLAEVLDPSKANAAMRAADPALPIGTGAHRFDWWMAMSKRVGIVDPYIRLHYTLPVTSSKAYDNCNAAGNDINGKPIDPDHTIMSKVGQGECNAVASGTDTFWKDQTGLQLPHVGGILVGAEVVPVEEGDESLRLAIGLQLSADYVSKGRYATDLSDMMRKLTYADQFFRLDSRLTFDLRFSKWVHWVTYLSLGTDTPHFLTSETVGKDRYGDGAGTAPDGKVTIGSPEMNPNYDFRADQPGRRFRVTEVSVFGLSSMLSVNF